MLGDLEQRGQDPARFTFVEIGAESGRSILDKVPHPFAAIRPIAVAQSLDLQGPNVVFSNELFDAQPCARFVRSADGWNEIGVKLDADQLTETHRTVGAPSPDLPSNSPRPAPRARFGPIGHINKATTCCLFRGNKTSLAMFVGTGSPVL